MDKQPFYTEDNIDWELNSYLNGMLAGAMLFGLAFAGLVGVKQYVDKHHTSTPEISKRVVTSHGARSHKIYKIKRVPRERSAQ